MLWKVFQASSLLYAGFIHLPELSSQSAFAAFRTLHSKSLKYALAIPKKTWEDNLLRHILIPTAEQGLLIVLNRACRSVLGHF